MLSKITSLIAFVSMLLCASIVISLAQETTLTGANEIRAKSLFQELRCVVCQNQSIGDSDADVARDLRQIVREQIETGKSDSQIREFLVVRYGEFILLKPAFGMHTILLWGAPIFLLLAGALILLRTRSSNQVSGAAPLSEAEEKELAKYLADLKEK